MTNTRNRRHALVAATALLFALAAGACELDAFHFDDPSPDLVVESIFRVPHGGGTYYYGSARNKGGIAAENIFINITPRDAGGASLGTYRGVVSVGYTAEEIDTSGTVTTPASATNTLEPDQSGAFNFVVPVATGAIASEDATFDYTLPVEGAEEEE